MGYMIKHKNRYLILGCAVLVLVFVYRSDVPRAKAITISPLTFEMTANPGDTLSNVMEVYNSEDTAIQVQMTLQDFAARGEEGKVVVVDDANETYSLAKWMTVEPQTFILGPKQRQVVNFTIRIPLNGEPGGHYGSVLAQTGSVDPSGTGATAIAQKLGTLVLLQVAGEVDEEMWIRSFEAPEFSEYGPITITSRFENIGTVHLKPQGFITITDILGRASKQVPLERKNVLPHSVRRIETPWGGEVALWPLHRNTHGNLWLHERAAFGNRDILGIAVEDTCRGGRFSFIPAAARIQDAPQDSFGISGDI